MPFTKSLGYDFCWSRGSEAYGVSDAHALHRCLPAQPAFRMMGLPAHESKGKITIPLHGLAMDARMIPDGYELDLPSALNYLRKQSISAPENNGLGWTVASYKNHSLGWMKIVPGRVNNHYPSNFRLRL